MSTRPLIAFTGLAGSGKSTAALHLVQRHGFARVRLAGPLKAMLRALGLTEQEVDGDQKEEPCELLGGQTPRWAMQTLGTEWGRELISGDLWTRAWWQAVHNVPVGQPVVVDDLRFINEAAAVQALNGTIVLVNRPGAGVGAAGHPSEGIALPHHATIDNAGSMDDFIASIDSLVETYATI